MLLIYAVGDIALTEQIFRCIDVFVQVLYMLMKKSVIQSSDTGHLELVDPFVEPLASCMSSKHLKVKLSV